MACALALCGCGSLEPSAPQVFPELTPYKVQMHVHGHSNHNGSTRPASMEWQSSEAAWNDAADVLWWTDHVGVFDQTRDLTVDFSRGILDPATFDITDLAPRDTVRSVTWLDAEHRGGTLSISTGSAGLLVELQAESKSAWQGISYQLKSSHPSGTVKGFRLARPLSSGAMLELHTEIDHLDDDSYAQIEIWLSWHHIPRPVQQHIIYRIVQEGAVARQEFLSEDTLLIRVPQVSSGVYTLDLMSATNHFRDGDDNTIQRISLGVAAREGATTSVTFVGLKLFSTNPDALHQLEMMQQFATRYQNRLDLHERIGMEFGTPGTHLNAFLETDLTTMTDLMTTSDVGAWVDKVHALGGLVSLNHPFGTSSGPNSLLDENERRLALIETADELLGNRACGADLLEVGYLARGGLDLQDHLDLWDILTARRVFLTGTGVNDSHGDFWNGEMRPNPFVTWVYSPSPATSDLLPSLETGAVFFGNPFYWDGRFAFRVGPFRMGEHSAIGDDPLLLEVELSPWFTTYEVFLVQGLLDPVSNDVTYLHRATVVTAGRDLALDVSRPSFIRLEVYEKLAWGGLRPLLFTNPIVFTAAD